MFGRDPGHRLALADLNRDFVRELSRDLDFFHLRDRLDAGLRAAQVHEKDVGAFVEIRGVQHGLGREHAVGFHVEHGHVVVRVFQDQPRNPFPDAEVQRGAQAGREQDLGAETEEPLLALQGGLAGSDRHVEHVLLAALTRCRATGVGSL